MKSKLVIAAVLIFILASLLSSTALADPDISAKIAKLDVRVQSDINKAVSDCDTAFAIYKLSVDNVYDKLADGKLSQALAMQKIYSFETAYNFQINDIMTTLQDKASKMTDVCMMQAYKQGIEVLREYIQVDIGGNIYLVDPLRIIGH